ncbi:MAG: AI-2E family transporter [Acidobacteriaceae bacterium]|nr:AI-2E family transporter [Acidobacteriaceae bacterium]
MGLPERPVRVHRPFRESVRVLGIYLRAQIVIAVIVTVLYAIGFGIARAPLWPLIAVVSGISTLVPRFGSLVPLVLVALAMLFARSDLTHLLIAFGTWVVVQAVEGFVLQPILLSKPLGLKAIPVFLALLVGGMFFGPIGFLLAVPVLAVANVFWRYFRDRSAQ